MFAFDQTLCAFDQYITGRVISYPPHSLTHSLNHSASLWHVSVCPTTRGVNLGDGGTRPPEFGVQNRNSLKFGQIFFIEIQNCLSFWGTSSHRPSTGASPLDPTGRLLSPDPLHRTSPTFCTRFTPLLRTHGEYVSNTCLSTVITDPLLLSAQLP